ncbi:hypothetical protein ACQEVF_56680 [Nonomuraea polychroma]|uniref:hypothetical protein n=1 Tax=Nonomuraea polychroma TaxID=46176 RepID=UPI003D8AAAD8
MNAADTSAPVDVLILRHDDPRLRDALPDPPSDGYTLLLAGDHDQFAVHGSHVQIATIVRRLAQQARRRFAGSGVRTLPDYSHPVYDIAAQLVHAGLVTDEDEALLAAAEVETYLHIRGFDIIKRRKEPDIPDVLHVDVGHDRSRLKPGTIIWRYADPGRGGWWAEMPCCERRVKLQPPAGDENADNHGRAIVCQPCTLLYRAALFLEDDEGQGVSYVGRFVVVDTDLAVPARRRRKKRA